ncbi:LysR family transcriptional regulator [Robbsia sp. KACC 23696]|uniref:LysR family transcriptional regulator n=1 Tax=Robbsia sp. KACC 23696 TaxID=3149231 RepID=UPI00325A7B1E
MSYTLQQLRHFAAVAETGSVSRAAEKCYISQPSLSASLKNLSELLGTPLFTRQRTGVALTAEGERFFKHTRQILQDVARADLDMRQQPTSVGGVVRIGVTETISGYLVPALLLESRRLFPDLDIQLVEDERRGIQRALLKREVDFALLLVSNMQPIDAISIRPLLDFPRKLWFSVDHPLRDRATISLQDVAEWDFYLLDKDEHVQTTKKYWASYGLAPKVVMKTKSPEAIRSLVANGLGVTILSDLTYREWSHEGGRIVRRTLSDPIPTMALGFAFRKDEILLPAVTHIVDMLRAFAGGGVKGATF